MLVYLIAVGLLLAVGYYLFSSARHPELIHHDNPENQALIASMPRLTRRFWPTPWLFNTHLQLLGLGLKKSLAPALAYDRVESLIMADGGTTALNWLGEELPAQAPTLLVLHTITGSPHSMRSFVRDLRALTAWRVVLCQRRGHGDLGLTSPRFNTMGDTDDLRLQIAAIAARYPDSPLYAAGISAGTGLLVRYLGEQGADTPLRAAFAYCPGYDISTAFGRARAPYSQLMARKLVRQFVLPNAEMFGSLGGFKHIRDASDLQEFHQYIWAFAGYDSHADYLQACNPVAVMDRIKVPLLVLNSADDPVCTIQNVREHQAAIAGNPHTILAITRRGSHCAHLAGWFAKPWAHQLAAEFLIAANSKQTQANTR